ncbi:MAG: TlpA family protein disulfide reductase [Balneolales bacterium]|nr:TlpA family protein disulfide reductase [Balneolales bacterium]
MRQLLPVLTLSGLLLIITSCNQKPQNPRPLTEEEARIESVLSRATFEDLDGNDVILSDFEGSVVLIDFWETWCGPCLMVFPALDSLKTEYGDDFVVLAVNTLGADNKEDVEQFVQEHDYDFVQLLDVNDVGSEVISLGIPFKVFIDPQGFLIKAELGSAGTQGDYEKAKVIIEDNKNS